MAGRIVIFDTSVFIDHLRTNKYREEFSVVSGLIRNSAVVLAELRRGATRQDELSFINTLMQNHPILTPTEKNWVESGEILSKLHREQGYSPEKLRDLHFDVLIALTARNFGATVVTSNTSDFELIRRCKSFTLEVW